MRAIAPTYYKLVFSLFALLLLSACGSEMTSIDAPETTVVGETFPVSATHQFSTSPDASSGVAGSPAGTEDPVFSLVFGVLVTPGWSGSPMANYQGTWDGTPVDLDLELLDGIPPTNLLAFLQEPGQDTPAEILQLVEISDCTTVLEALGESEGADDYDLLFYQTIDSLTLGPEPQPGDSGEFFFDLTAGNTGDEGDVVIIHGLTLGQQGVGDPEGDVFGCFWYPDAELSDIEGPFIPSAVFDTIRLFGSETMPVPVMGGVMIALLSLLLAVVGIVMGRRKSEQAG